MADETAEATETSPPERAEDGTYLQNGAPLNARLRAEHFAKAGKVEDPHGLVPPELIRDAKDRLAAQERDRAAAEAAAPSLSWSKDKLLDEAEHRQVAVADGATKADILAALEGAAAGTQEG